LQAAGTTPQSEWLVHIEFRLLGPVEAVADGRTLPLGGRRERAVLAFLLLHAGEVVSADQLVDVLWEADPPEEAYGTIATDVSRLRLLLGELLVDDGLGYRLDVASEQVDVGRLGRLLIAGRSELAEGHPERAVALIRQGLALRRGPSLADLDEAFARAAAARLDSLVLDATEAWAEAELALGHEAVVVAALEPLGHVHPYRERLREQLMLALYRSGRQGDALEVYDETRRLLREDLGVLPGPELQALAEAIIRRESSLDRPRPAPRRRVAALAAAVVLVVIAAVLAVMRATEGSPDAGKRLPFPPLPHRLLGTYRVVVEGAQPADRRAPLTLTLRESRDPVCRRLVGRDDTCFTIVPTLNPDDEGARGEAAVRDGDVVLRFMVVPFGTGCDGEIDRFHAAGRRVVWWLRAYSAGRLCSPFAAFVAD
jgi:DNA-binding SARP family transcriptional activator